MRFAASSRSLRPSDFIVETHRSALTCRLVGGDARPELMASAALSAATHRSTSRREYGVYASSRSAEFA